jgi:hypothetical protein
VIEKETVNQQIRLNNCRGLKINKKKQITANLSSRLIIRKIIGANGTVKIQSLSFPQHLLKQCGMFVLLQPCCQNLEQLRTYEKKFGYPRQSGNLSFSAITAKMIYLT